MKRYAIRTAKRLSEDADRTLQDTLRFRNSIGDNLKQSGVLKAELDHLNETLASIRESNENLASNRSEDDLELQPKMKLLNQQIDSQNDRLQDEVRALKAVEERLDRINAKLSDLTSTGEQRMITIKAELYAYSKYLGIAIEAESSYTFRVTFQDINQSVLLKIIDFTKLSIDQLSERIESNINDPLAIGKVLYRAREALKS